MTAPRTVTMPAPHVHGTSRLPRDADTDFMLRVQREEPGAFAELMRRYEARVFGRLYRLLGDRQEAEDLTQDVFLRVYRARQHYRPRAKFATWLFCIVQNVARNAVRSRRRHPCRRLGLHAVPGRDDRPAENTLAARCEAPSQPVERAELAAVVRAAVSTLAGRQRTALELFEFHDHTCPQIAAEMHMTAKAVKSMLYRARNQLRLRLTGFMEAVN